MFNIDAQSSESKKLQAGSIREKRLIRYFVGDHETRLGDRFLALPHYTFPLSRFQYCLGRVKPSLYYIPLSGSVVGLSCDPSFVPKEEESEQGARDVASPFPEACYIPPLMQRFPICANVGVGVVHSIDLKRNLITIITPVDEESMKSVNTIVQGKQALPQALMENV